MKNILIAMSVIAFAFTSCEKSSNSLSVKETTPTDNLLATDAIHYYHGVRVTHQHEITGFMSDQSATLMTDKINGIMECYYFDSEQEEIAFLQNYPVMQPLAQRIAEIRELRSLAASSGAIEHYQKTGEIIPSYQAVLDQKRTRGGYGLYQNLNSMGAAFYIPGATPAFPLFMDNNAESWRGVAGFGDVFTNPFFAGPALAIYATPTFVNLPLVWRNVISSAW